MCQTFVGIVVVEASTSPCPSVQSEQKRAWNFTEIFTSEMSAPSLGQVQSHHLSLGFKSPKIATLETGTKDEVCGTPSLQGSLWEGVEKD